MKQSLFSDITIALAPVAFLCCTNDTDGYSHRLIFFHGFSYSFFSLEDIVIVFTKPTGLFDIRGAHFE